MSIKQVTEALDNLKASMEFNRQISMEKAQAISEMRTFVDTLFNLIQDRLTTLRPEFIKYNIEAHMSQIQTNKIGYQITVTFDKITPSFSIEFSVPKDGTKQIGVLTKLPGKNDSTQYMTDDFTQDEIDYIIAEAIEDYSAAIRVQKPV